MAKLIIWDLDGTLINSLQVTLDVLNDGLEPFLNQRLTSKQILSYFGPSEAIIFERILGNQSQAQQAMQIMLNSFANKKQQIHIFDGIIEVLLDLKSKNYTQAIFTGRGLSTAEPLLEALDLKKFFSMIITTDSLTNPKPHPEGIEKILNQLSFDAKNTIMIGDSTIDAQSARAANVIALGCLWSDHASSKTALEASGVHQVVSTPRDLVSIIESINY